jgi:CRISPR-associated protein Cst2
MANPIVTAAILVEANGAALNNSGEPIERARTDNTVSVKSIKIGARRYP